MIHRILLLCFLALVLGQTSYVYEYDLTDTTCASAPVRVYTIGTTCQRGPIPFRFGYGSCSNNASTSTIFNCLTCNDISSCTIIVFNTGGCTTALPAPSGNANPFKLSCSPDSSVSLTPSVTYTEYQDGFCQLPLQSYNQTKSGCVDNGFWDCTSTGVNYSPYDGTGCTGTGAAPQFLTYNACKSVGTKYIKVGSCTRSTPNAGHATKTSVFAGILVGIITFVVGS
jgi:hypothetical protein